MRKVLSIAFGAACFAALTLALLEGLLALWLASTSLPVTPLLRRLYAAETLYPQFDPACARHDAELFYALRPGVCRFETREFSTELRINRAGFRDDDASLQAPPIVAAGDSTTIGWGVAEYEAYPAVLEDRLGVQVLNTGVPSYGTVREMASLDRVDTSALSTLIVQFDTNDHGENKSFFRIGRSASDGAQHRQRTEEAVRRASYRPGKHIRAALELVREGRAKPISLRKAADEVEFFLYALRHASSVDLSRVHVIVFVMEALGGRYGPSFLAALEAARAADPEPGWLGRLSTVDVSADIQPELRYRLDGHIGAESHRRIAERLAGVIEGGRQEPGLAEPGGSHP